MILGCSNALILKGAFMDEKISIAKKESAQKIEMTFEIGGNTSRRKINVSGPDSEGEKSLLKKNPDWLVSPKVNIPVLNSCLSCIDEVLATPSFNVSVIESAYDSNFKFFDSINKSRYAVYIDSAVASLGFLAVSIGIYVSRYCKLRDIERNSHYFYFSRLFKTGNERKIKNIMGEIGQDHDNFNNSISLEHLLSTAHFYPPNISKIACWRRRFFASGKELKRLNSLNKFLIKNSKKEALDKLHGIITEKISQLLNGVEKSKKFQVKKDKNKWIIGLTDSYAEKFFNSIENQIKKNSNTCLVKNQKKTKNIIPSILTALMQASFIYWILMFFFVLYPWPQSLARHLFRLFR